VVALLFFAASKAGHMIRRILSGVRIRNEVLDFNTCICSGGSRSREDEKKGKVARWG